MKITDVTDITDFHRVQVHGRGAHIQAFTFSSQDHGRLSIVHVSKHSLFSWRRHSQDHGRLSGVVCGVCGVLWWCDVVVCVCCVVVVRVCGVVKLGTLSLSCSLSFLFSFPFFFLSYLSFSPFFFFFFFSCSFSYSCSCSCSFSFSSFFFLPFYSLFSSLPFTPTNTVQSTDQQTRSTLRRLNVMWRTVRHSNCHRIARNVPTSPPPSSSLLPPPSLPHPEKREGTLYYKNISGEGIILYYSFRLIQKNQRRVKLQSLQFYIKSKTLNLHHVKSVIIFAKMVTVQASCHLEWSGPVSVLDLCDVFVFGCAGYVWSC